MPEKSVREMSKWELKHYSLNAKVFHATIIGCLVLGLLSLAVGLYLYTLAVTEQYIGEAFGLSRSVSTIVESWVDTEEISCQVLDTYRGLTEEQRQQTGTEAYRALFSSVTEEPVYQSILGFLRVMRESSDVSDVYLGYYDQDTGALVYICDPDDSEESGFFPGDWETVDQREINKFHHWDGQSKLYDISNMEKYGWICTAGVPLKNRAGEITGFILADITLDEIWQGVKPFLVYFSLAVLVITGIIGVVLTNHMKKKLVEPINEIADAAHSYVVDRRGGSSAVDHFARLHIRTGDEIENLALIMADMEKDLSDYEQSLGRITAEKERISTELSLATRIQADMLPNIFPAFPERPEFDIFASMDPAKEVGGDFYDFFLIDDHHLGMVMADVSGKGVPAALFMMVSKILLKNYAMAGQSPAQVLESVNRQICSNNREQMFVTVWFGVLDMLSGVLTAASAGHEYPVFKRAQGQFELFKDRHGFVIGGMAGVKYKQYEVQMAPGDKLFLYTDGVPEATNSREELFGTERMLAALNAEGDGTPQQILQSVRRAVDVFVGDAPQFDDLTMLCAQYFGKQPGRGGQS